MFTTWPPDPPGVIIEQLPHLCTCLVLPDQLCEHYERTVTPDNCVSFEGRILRIPPDKYRCHYVKVKVRVHRYIDGSLAIFHGPRKLADYDENGNLKKKKKEKAA